MSSYWTSRRVLLTGGSGFLGSYLRRRIEREQPAALLAPRRSELDLVNPAQVRAYLSLHRPDIVIHAAGVVGGIAANADSPGRFFYENAVMGIHLIEEARRANAARFVCLGTICAYPKFAPVPFREDDLWNGYPEETNAPYGIAKKALLVQLQAYRQEYGFNGIFLLPVNLYGPGDNFDLHTSHVIPAMIRKFLEARERGASEVVLWGDGTPTREFLYAEDAAEGVILATEHYDSAEPVNLGSGEELPISTLAGIIARKTGYDGRVIWDATRPNGQPRRGLDVTRAAERFGFKAKTRLDEGLGKTIDWFLDHRPGV
jgi:GDP-L-fucose synthase